MATDQVNMSVAVSGQESPKMPGRAKIADIITTKKTVIRILRLATVVDNEVIFSVKSGRIVINRLSKDYTELIHMDIPDWYIGGYNVFSENDIAFDGKQLLKVLTALPDKTAVVMRLYENRIEIESNGIKFEIPAYNADSWYKKEPETDSLLSFYADVKELKKILDQIVKGKYGIPEIEIVFDGEKTYIKDLDYDSEAEYEVKMYGIEKKSEPISVKYNARKLRNFLKSINGGTVRIDITEKKHMRINSTGVLDLRYWLAYIA